MFFKMLVDFFGCLREESLGMHNKSQMPRVGALGSVLGLSFTDIASLSNHLIKFVHPFQNRVCLAPMICQCICWVVASRMNMIETGSSLCSSQQGSYGDLKISQNRFPTKCVKFCETGLVLLSRLPQGRG